MHKEHNSNKWNIPKVLNRQWLLSSLENTTDVMRLMTRRMTPPPIILEPIHLSGSSWSLSSFSPSQTANYHVLQILHPQKMSHFLHPHCHCLIKSLMHAPQSNATITYQLPWLQYCPISTHSSHSKLRLVLFFLKKHKFSHVSALYSICNHP